MTTTTTSQTTTTSKATLAPTSNNAPAFTFNGAAEVARQVSDLAKLGRKAGNMRDSVLRTVLAATTANNVPAEKAAEWFKGFSAEVRKVRFAGASKQALAEYKSMNDKARQSLYGMHTDTAPVMSEGCAALESWRQTWNARSSDVKKMLLASYDARHVDLFAMFDGGKVSASYVLEEVSKSATTAEQAPAEQETTAEQAPAIVDLASLSEDARALVRKAANAGLLAEFLNALPAIVAEQANAIGAE